MAALRVGQPAPDFTLIAQDGTPVSLSQLKCQAVVLYFYPKDDTPGCTAEACAFRDQYTVFQESGAKVIGVSSDSPQSHQAFATKYRLPFTLLSDPGDKTRKRYEVPPTFWFIPGRVTFVIDTAGVIQHIFDSQFDFQAHVTESLKTLKQI